MFSASGEREHWLPRDVCFLSCSSGRDERYIRLRKGSGGDSYVSIVYVHILSIRDYKGIEEQYTTMAEVTTKSMLPLGAVIVGVVSSPFVNWKSSNPATPSKSRSSIDALSAPDHCIHPRAKHLPPLLPPSRQVSWPQARRHHRRVSSTPPSTHRQKHPRLTRLSEKALVRLSLDFRPPAQSHAPHPRYLRLSRAHRPQRPLLRDGLLIQRDLRPRLQAPAAVPEIRFLCRRSGGEHHQRAGSGETWRHAAESRACVLGEGAAGAGGDSATVCGSLDGAVGPAGGGRRECCPVVQLVDV